MTMEHIMLDLETLGVSAGCSIVSIGAVFFNPNTKTLGEEFYTVVNRQSCRDQGLVEDDGTRQWWSTQPAEIAKTLVEAEAGYSLVTALGMFCGFTAKGGENVKLWGNGSAFDNAILASAFKACGLQPPWKFYHDRCYRTLKAIYGKHLPIRRHYGAHHNALNDAKNQAANLLEFTIVPALA